jgi:teichuronic acid biosynthesis glycosyltransferase TuaG
LDDQSTPVVTVVTPCRNAEQWLEQAIRSVRAQRHEDWEMWVIDDASTDASLEVAQSHARMDRRIHVLRLDQRMGGAAARNEGIRRARGRYIAFLDADDWWHADKLAVQLLAMQQRGAAFMYSAYEKCNERGCCRGRLFIPPSSVDYRSLLRTCVIGCSTVMLDRRILGRRCMPRLPMAHDFALWLEILREGHVAYGCPEALTVYRERRGSLSANKLAKSVVGWWIYRQRESLGVMRSLGLMGSYAWNGLRKRFI